MRIEACFDSHVHWPATGDFSERLDLSKLSEPREILKLNCPAPNRSQWILGFGWNDETWSEQPSAEILDQWCRQHPVALSRSDGHGLWLNSLAIKEINLNAINELSSQHSQLIKKNEMGQASGLVYDLAAEAVREKLPPLKPTDLRRHLIKGMKIFNRAGFTHIRDMTCDENQWQECTRLDEAGLLTMAAEEFFWLKASSDLETVIATLKMAHASPTANLRAKGVKIFLDGALGSEGAWLSQSYQNKQPCSHGHAYFSREELREIFSRVWLTNPDFEVAVHAIGDEAVHQVVLVASELAERGIKGILNIEHAEIVRPETIELMKKINVRCHFQPSHWLSDHPWLEKKVADLAQYAFPWRKMQEADIAFFFGSDSPVEKPSVQRTLEALDRSAQAGIGRLLGSALSYMSHPNLSWAPNSYSHFDSKGHLLQLVFRGEHFENT